MKIFSPAIDFIRRRIQGTRSAGRSLRGGGRIAVVHWDRENLHYLVVAPKSKKILPLEFGSVAHADVANPFVALAEHFRLHSLPVQRLVILLSRPELELFTLTLPPADASELPGLVASEIEQQLGEADEAPVIDFHVVPSTSTNSTDATASSASNAVQVLAFALPASVQQSLQAQTTGAGFRIAAICSRHLSPLGLLRRKHVPENTPAVSVHLYAGEAELAICRGSEPILLRSIRVNLEEPSQVAEQILLESQRCLALLPHEFSDQPFNWFIYTTCEAAWQVAQALEDHDQLAIQPVDPLIGWEIDQPTDSTATMKFATAANSGAAWEYLNGELPVNFVSPKKPPKSANPMMRWAAIAAAAALVLITGVSFALSDVNQLRAEVQTLQAESEGTQKVTAKFREKADQVGAIENWLSDQVDWVTELNELSKRLPDGQNATVRRLTASANARTAVIDLAVQVAKQETISHLEASIRSAKYAVTSKQISQNPESVEYPWQFDTRVVFSVEPFKENSDYQSQADRGTASKQPIAEATKITKEAPQ